MEASIILEDLRIPFCLFCITLEQNLEVFIRRGFMLNVFIPAFLELSTMSGTDWLNISIY